MRKIRQFRKMRELFYVGNVVVSAVNVSDDILWRQFRQWQGRFRANSADGSAKTAAILTIVLPPPTLPNTKSFNRQDAENAKKYRENP